MSEGTNEGRTAQVRAEAHRGSYRFAERSAELVSKAPFFAFCVALVVVWAPSYFPIDAFDTYQLLINTPTIITTFLLVALLQNAQRRGERAIHKRLDALADGIADLMRHFAQEDNELHKEIEDLKAAVGLEEEV